MIDKPLAFIDIETTGGRVASDRITEIALVIWKNGEVLQAWQSLVNPRSHIPSFIQRLTGITDSLVADAPLFEDIAGEFEQLTRSCIFVAHNARFDYGFIKTEFKRIGKSYSRQVLCTVKLAKALYPQHQGHGLDKLIERHGLVSNARHRAMGDVESTLAFFNFAQQDAGAAAFEVAIAKQVRRPSLPQGLDETRLDALPDTAGVYYFYGENHALLYVGKSINLYQRVMSHFCNDHSSNKEMAMTQSVRNIEWQQCPGEFSALLLEIQEIKALQPVYNARLRPNTENWTIFLSQNAQGYLVPLLRELTEVDKLGSYYGLYKTRSAAKKFIKSVLASNQLCALMMDIEQGEGPCFKYKLGECLGACVNEENIDRYNLRMQIAFHSQHLKDWPYQGFLLIKEVEQGSGAVVLHVFKYWCHIGSYTDEANLNQAMQMYSEQQLSFDADVYRLLKKQLKKQVKGLEFFEFKFGDAI